MFCATCPGMSIMLRRVASIWKPWITSREVAVKVTSAPAGTRMTLGLKPHAKPMITAS